MSSERTIQSAPDDRPRLLLHPGHAKCGSSTIQYAVYSNLESLQRQGVYVPNRRFEFEPDGAAYYETLGNPVRYLGALTDSESVSAFEDRLVGAIDAIQGAGGHTVLISAENLGNLNGITKLRPVHEVLARHFSDVRALFYIRRQDEWLASSWQQWGHKLGWSFARHVDQNLSAGRPDFLGTVRFLEDTYETLQLDVVPLNRDALLGGDLVTDFSMRTGLGPLPLDESDQYRNASFGGALCDVFSRVHTLYEDRSDHRIRDLLSRFPASRDLTFSRDKRVLTPAIRKRVLEHFRADNEVLHGRFFPDVQFEALFGVGDQDDAELEVLRTRIDGLTDVVSIQMEIILSLLERVDASPEPTRFMRGLPRWSRRRRSRRQAR